MQKMLMILVMTLALALLCAISAGALAEGYTRGDKMEDFTVTLSDGSVFTLSEALKEKKAMLLNFWASWCSPCKMEMPAMNEACSKLSGEVAFVCLSTEKNDTSDTIASLRERLGLDVLPMGLDSDDLYDKYDNPTGGIPFTVAIDKNGVICFSESGSIPDANKFIALMETFTADDYDEPQMVYDLPSVKPNVEPSSEADMHKAIGAEGMTIANANGEDLVWPFVVSSDGACVYASNRTVKDSLSAFTVSLEAEAGEGVAFEYAVDDMPTMEVFGVSIDGADVSEVMAGSKDWTENAVTFDESGAHTVAFLFHRDAYVDGEMVAAIRSVRKVSAEEAQKIMDAKDKGIKTLEGDTVEIEALEGEFKDAIIDFGKDDSMEVKVLREGSSVKLRIRIGQDVDFEHAYLSVGSNYIMLNELEHDDEGYLYTPNSIFNEDDMSSIMGVNVSVFPSVLKVQESTPLATFSYQPSEESMDSYVTYLDELIRSMAVAQNPDGKPEHFTWSWADGSKKKETVPAETPSTMNADGTANYTVMVTDKDGRGIAQVMVQVCTTETCQVYFTDADGMVQFTNAPYAYEVHILKAPDGYQKPVETYLLAKEGGRLVVQLNAAQ